MKKTLYTILVSFVVLAACKKDEKQYTPLPTQFTGTWEAYAYQDNSTAVPVWKPYAAAAVRHHITLLENGTYNNNGTENGRYNTKKSEYPNWYDVTCYHATLSPLGFRIFSLAADTVVIQGTSVTGPDRLASSNGGVKYVKK